MTPSELLRLARRSRDDRQIRRLLALSARAFTRCRRSAGSRSIIVFRLVAIIDLLPPVPWKYTFESMVSVVKEAPP